MIAYRAAADENHNISFPVRSGKVRPNWENETLEKSEDLKTLSHCTLRSLSVLTDLYLIRHGQPVTNTTISYNTLPGPDLAERGRVEARQAAAFLADRGLQQLFVSPFARTTQTAEVLVDQLDLPVIFTPLIQEHGPGEDFGTVRARIRELLAATDDSPYSTIGIVSHGSPIRAALVELSGDKIDLSRHVYPGGNPAPPCGIWHVRFIDEQTRRFELVFRPQ